MKKTLLIIIFTLVSSWAYCQNNGDFKYSIGVRAYNYLQMPNVLSQSNNDKYITSYLSSYIVKFNDNLFSYRINGSYLKEDLKFSNNCETCDIVDGKMKDFSFKVGFEKNFNYSVIQPYVALDLGYRSNKFKGSSNDLNEQRIAIEESHTNINATKEGFTVTPTIGIKINPTKQLSVFAESNLEFFYAYERQERIVSSDPNNRSLRKLNKGEYLINPVALGIQFHFGAKN
ncbi:hypothetical protein [Pedobacter sp.]|uniref:hypothetical protein n=1 Tax=Pedobacter sp. TaxID=1411316 RepID=UPI003D7FAF52